jgi:hypothetical protein
VKIARTENKRELTSLTKIKTKLEVKYFNIFVIINSQNAIKRNTMGHYETKASCSE